MSVAWVGAAVAVAGAAVKVHQSNMAASAQRRAIGDANDMQQQEYDQAREDYAPYRATGLAATNALNGLIKDPSSIVNDPGYQFGLNQGVTARDRSGSLCGWPLQRSDPQSP
jgi:hypothetical protein